MKDNFRHIRSTYDIKIVIRQYNRIVIKILQDKNNFTKLYKNCTKYH